MLIKISADSNIIAASSINSKSKTISHCITHLNVSFDEKRRQRQRFVDRRKETSERKTKLNGERVKGQMNFPRCEASGKGHEIVYQCFRRFYALMVHCTFTLYIYLVYRRGKYVLSDSKRRLSSANTKVMTLLLVTLA